MLITLVLGIAAGAGASYAEPHLKPALENLFSDGPISETDLKLYALALCLVAAAILSWILGNGSAITLTVGGAIGVFGPRLLAMAQKRRAPDYGDDL